MLRLVVATKNAHKIDEISQILGAEALGIELVPYAGESPAETGLTFVANAIIKARAAARATGLPALADDSGIIVDAMGAAPGIFSAHWSGERDDAKNRALLLRQLYELGDGDRGAAFVCSVALVGADAWGEARGRALAGEITATGHWAGSIALQERGTHGFGYDPIFIPSGMNVTAAELEPVLKNAHSHRSQALSQLRGYLL